MKKFLVPTDFSTNATNALKYANAFIKAVGGDLTLLNVYTPSVGKFNPISGIIAEEIAEGRIEGLKKLNALSKKHVLVPCKNLVQSGDAVEVIVGASKTAKADIVIMGTHGASGVKQILMGSNTASVIAKSDVPVIAIPQGYRFKKVKTIVYASDLKNPMNELKYLIPYAKKLNATIEILNIDYHWGDEDDKKKKEFLKKIKSLAYKKIKYVEQNANIEIGVAAYLKKYLLKRKPEMLVMFPEEKSWFDKIFIGSNTKELAYQIKLPLFSIRKSIVKKA